MTKTTNLTPGVQQTLVLHNGLDIPVLLAERVRAQVLDRLPGLQRDHSYSLRAICGPEFWRTLDKLDSIKAGRYVAHLVSMHQLPLVFDVCPHRSNKRYRLR